MEDSSPHNRFSKILHSKLTIIIGIILIIVLVISLIYLFSKTDNCPSAPGADAQPNIFCQNIL